MLSATDFLHLIIIMGFVVDAIKVGNVNIQVFAHGGIRIDAVLAVGDGLVTVEERRPFPREGQHGVVSVVDCTVDVQVDEVDVPVVLVAALSGQRRIDDAGIVVETEIEVVLEEFQVGDGYHYLFEVLTVVFAHESLKFLPGHAPDVVPSGVGHGGEY